MKIKEGMYVRTTKGIGKIEQVIDTDDKYDKYRYIVDISKIYIFNDDDVLTEPSFDIIDLIKPGDYVNGKEVIIAGYNIYDDWCVTVKSDDGCNDYIYPKEIKSIVTKEQFESMSYIVE